MTKERGGGLIFLAAGIYGLIFSVQFPLGRWNQPGPGVFPLGLSILLCICGISWCIQGKGTGEKREPVGLGRVVRRFMIPLQIVGVTAAFILTFELLGYLLASSLFLFLLFFRVSRYGFWTALMLAVACGAGSGLFFGKLLSTPLPGGILSL